MLHCKQVLSRSAQVHAASCHTQLHVTYHPRMTGPKEEKGAAVISSARSSFTAGFAVVLACCETVSVLCTEPAQPVHRAAVVLPAGFSVREVVSAAKPRGYIEYVAACPIHGAGKRLDRWKEVADFMRAHHGCRRVRPCKELQHRLTHAQNSCC